MSLLKRIRNAAPLLHSINKLTTAALLLNIHQAASAQSIGGLSRAQTTLQTLRDNLDVILPIAAIIIGIIIFVLYSAEVMRKDDAIRWGIGVLLAGSAAPHPYGQVALPDRPTPKFRVRRCTRSGRALYGLVWSFTHDRIDSRSLS